MTNTLRQLVLRPIDGSGDLAVFVESDSEVEEARACYRASVVSLTQSSLADMAFKQLLAANGLREWWNVGRA